MQLLTLMAVATLDAQQTMVNGRPSVLLESTAAQVVIDIRGGSFVSFKLKGLDLNPLVWNNAGDAQPRQMSHFLCLDRWGQPSAAELANGMPYHGEAGLVEWKVLRATSAEAEMTATLPMAGMEVWRRAKLTGAVLFVEERVTNRNKLGKPYNMVQHPSIGPPFLDETTLVDANAKRGLMQSSAMPNPEHPTVVWPQALKDGIPVDLRRLANDPLPEVVSFVIDEPWGWVTAVTPAPGLMLGYLWKTSEYPWLSIWRHVVDGKPFARGLEFGTTGLHQPYPILAEKGRIFDRRLFSYLDAGESHTRTFAAFLARTPAGSQGIRQIALEGAKIVVTERGRPQKIELAAPDLASWK